MSAPAVETVTTLEGFDSLAGEWDVLVGSSRRPSPFLLHGWLRALWPLCEQPRVCVAQGDGRLVGALALDVRRRRGLRVAEFIGGNDAHLADLLIGAGEDGNVAEALVEAAAGFDYADLFGMPDGSRLESMRGLRLVERVEAPVLDLSGDWETVYAAKASAKTRQTHRRKLRRLNELGRLEFATATAPDDVAAALEDTFRIHELRWRGRRDTSGLARPEMRDAHRSAYRSLAGTARILTLSLDGQVIAYNCFLVVAKQLYSHRLAFDPAFAQWSPGLVSTLELCRQAAAEGIERIEFLGGGEEYKLQLADRTEPLFQGIGLARTAAGRAVAAARLGSVLARRRLKRFRRLHRLYVEGVRPARRSIASLYTSR
jgi:CelD/BcsL family acetyltransferase involved in cellulose biosynthesis